MLLIDPPPKIPEGLYPFIDERVSLSELVMAEAPPQLETLFKSEASARILAPQPQDVWTTFAVRRPAM